MQDTLWQAIGYRYEYCERRKTLIKLRLVREWIGDVFMITRVTEVPFGLNHRNNMDSASLDGWGSCQLGWPLPLPTRDELIDSGHIMPHEAIESELPALLLDWKAWSSHRFDQLAIAKGMEPELPVEVIEQEESQYPNLVP